VAALLLVQGAVLLVIALTLPPTLRR